MSVAAGIFPGFVPPPGPAASEEGQRIERAWLLITDERDSFHSAHPIASASRFARLAKQWQKARRLLSSAEEMAALPSYRRIVEMGGAAIPFLLREMEQRPDHWDFALRAITGLDPVGPELAGSLPDIAQTWVKWGEDSGYRW